MVDDILQVAERHLAKLNARQRETCPASELVVGMQCGGSDAFSGVTANPAVGYASDLLVRCGATVMFSEVTEVRDAIHLLTPRAINEEVGKRLLEEMAWYDNYLDSGQTDRSANPSPGIRKAAWRTWWKKRWARSPNPARARLPRSSHRASAQPNAA
jgi:galactarate dehydratase